MKYLTLLSLFIACIINNAFAQIDTATAKRVTQLETTVSGIKQTVDDINAKLTTTQPSTQPNQQPATNTKMPAELSAWQKFYTLLPIIMFLLLFFTLIIWLKRDGFRLGDALSGDVPIEVTIPNPATPAAVVQGSAAAPAAVVQGNPTPATVSVTQTNTQSGQPELPKSSSRFIALFSGFAAIVIAVCLVSYYVYFGIRGTPAPSFDNIFEAVLGLGIGIVPYVVNKLTKPNK